MNLSPRNEGKQYGRQIRPFSFKRSPLLTNVEHLFRQTNKVGKGFHKRLKSRSDLLFDHDGLCSPKKNYAN